jgi:hypothetical protein
VRSSRIAHLLCPAVRKGAAWVHASCTAVGHASCAGAFLKKPTAAEPHRLLFQPGGERSCRYEQYSRAEVLAALQGGAAEDEHPGMDILVSTCCRCGRCAFSCHASEDCHCRS